MRIPSPQETDKTAVTIRPARLDEQGALTAVALRAKGHWGYPAAVMAQWQGALTVSDEEIRQGWLRVAERGGVVVGFSALIPHDGPWELDDLWVDPSAMGHGVGRALLDDALARAAQGGATGVTVDADPYAERFYLHCGAVRVGAVAAPIPDEPTRVRPQLTFDLTQ